ENDFSLQYTIAQPATLFFPTQGTPSALRVADLNNDNKLDLVAASTDLSNPINVLLGVGDGTFQASRGFDAGPGAPSGTRDLAVGDLTGSGNQDVVVSNYGSGDVSMLLGRGDGTLQPPRRFNAVPQVDSIAVGDFTGNGPRDLVVLEKFSNNGPEQLAIL